MTHPQSMAGATVSGELDGFTLDPRSLEYFRRYFTEYFQDEFIPGQGTEHVLDMLAGLGPARRWLDLGAGTSTLFWAIGLTAAAEIHCADASPEALAVLRDFVHDDGPPPVCYQQVLDRLGRDNAHLRRMRDAFGAYHVFDVMNDWPAALDEFEFDLITEFGLYSLAPDSEAYRRCFRRLARCMPPGGRALGVDWIRSARFIGTDKHDNTYLTEDLVRGAAGDAGLDLRTLRRCPIAGDDLYDALIVWSAVRPQERKSTS